MLPKTKANGFWFPTTMDRDVLSRDPRGSSSIYRSPEQDSAFFGSIVTSYDTGLVFLLVFCDENDPISPPSQQKWPLPILVGAHNGWIVRIQVLMSIEIFR